MSGAADGGGLLGYLSRYVVCLFVCLCVWWMQMWMWKLTGVVRGVTNNGAMICLVINQEWRLNGGLGFILYSSRALDQGMYMAGWSKRM